MKKNSFSTHFLDRASIERTDPGWVKSRLNDKSAHFIPVFETRVLCGADNYEEPMFLSLEDLKLISGKHDDFILLGLTDDKPYFAINLVLPEEASRLSDQKQCSFVDFRRAAPLLSYKDSALLSLARFMVNWHLKNIYCGRCGRKTQVLEAGNTRICTNDQCKQVFYPSMDPAVIVLVSSGEKCLLGRQPPWPKAMYSTIAGFVEPGESIENAVYREVEEETGIRVENITYLSSQPWLFPSSLMLGFNAGAINTKISINKDELEDARWFTREEIRDNLTKDLMKLPMKVSIAYNLIKGWYEQGNTGKLDDLIES